MNKLNVGTDNGKNPCSHGLSYPLLSMFSRF